MNQNITSAELETLGEHKFIHDIKGHMDINCLHDGGFADTHKKKDINKLITC